MSLSLQASADGNTVDLLLGSTVIAKFSANGIESGVLIASDAEAQGLTNLKKLLSPEKLDKAFKGANQALTTNGYQKLPGGLILQWGEFTYPNVASPTNFVVTLPIAFATSFLQAYSTDQTIGASTVTTGTWRSDLSSATQLRFDTANGQNAGLQSWFAIGF